jgi:hypothetical protein
VARYGAHEHQKYLRMMDALAADNDIPIVHILQPFLFSNPKSMIRRSQVPAYAHAFLRNGHPSGMYQHVRTRFRELYETRTPQRGIWWADYSEALGKNRENWIDAIHPSAQGIRIIARKLTNEALTEQVLQQAIRHAAQRQKQAQEN